MNLKRMISWLTALALAVGLCGGLSVPARAAASRTVANVVVFVDFADTTIKMNCMRAI